MRKMLLALGVTIGLIIISLICLIYYAFYGILGLPFGKAIISSDIKRSLNKTYPSINFKVNKLDHTFEDGYSAEVEAETKTPIKFYIECNHIDDSLLINLVIRKYPKYEEKNIFFDTNLLNANDSVLKVYWYDDHISKEDFLKEAIEINDLLNYEGVNPEKIYFERTMLLKFHPEYPGVAWDYYLTKITLDKDCRKHKPEELLSKVQVKYYAAN